MQHTVKLHQGPIFSRRHEYRRYFERQISITKNDDKNSPRNFSVRYVDMMTMIE